MADWEFKKIQPVCAALHSRSNLFNLNLRMSSFWSELLSIQVPRKSQISISPNFFVWLPCSACCLLTITKNIMLSCMKKHEKTSCFFCIELYPVQTDSAKFFLQTVMFECLFEIRKPVFYLGRKPVQMDSAKISSQTVRFECLFYIRKPVFYLGRNGLRA